jgi:hypothetical protein
MFKWIFRRNMTKDDIEGRCEWCAKRLNIEITVISQEEINLKVIPCKDHPKSAIILWPQRKDLIRKSPKNFLKMLNKESGILKLEVKHGLIDYYADKN